MGFLGEDYLLESKSSKNLYAEIENLPILDPHNHADIREIVENRPWRDLWEVEGATDHYVWELMRRCGIREELITGPAANREKWTALASVFPRFIGNPTYEWVHLDLKRRFGIEEYISNDTADLIWEKILGDLQTPDFRPRSILEAMKVEVMCTTDDPTLSLPYHEKARSDKMSPRILPTWRPDKALNIESGTWKREIDRLAEEADRDISDLDDLLLTLEETHRYFDNLGCVASDHGLTQPFSAECTRAEIQPIFQKALRGEALSEEEVRRFKAFLVVFFAELNAERDWVMQLHIGPVRDYRDSLFTRLGPDSGGDISTNHVDFVNGLRYLLNRFDGRLRLVLYCVDPTHLPTLATIVRAFPDTALGAPWWFNDSPVGMEIQLKYTASVDLLWNHAGMVTDSRKLISFGSRTEMFRRTLCNVVGGMVENGQIPFAPGLDLVRHLAYGRAFELFFSRHSRPVGKS